MSERCTSRPPRSGGIPSGPVPSFHDVLTPRGDSGTVPGPAGTRNYAREQHHENESTRGLDGRGIGDPGSGRARGPAGRRAAGEGGQQARDRNMPKPYATAFIRPPVLPYTAMSDANGPYRLYTVTEQRSVARIVNGLDTPVYGYNGSVPGPTIRVPQGTRVKLRVRNKLPATHPAFGHAVQHLDPPARLGVAAAVRRVRRRHHPPRAATRTTGTRTSSRRAPSGTTTTACTTPPRTSTAGLAAQYHLQTRSSGRCLPQGEYDVPLTLTDAMFAADGKLAYDDNDALRPVGRRHPGQRPALAGDEGQAADLPVPRSSTPRSPGRCDCASAPATRSTMVATDGGLMPAPQQVDELAAGRRRALRGRSSTSPGTPPGTTVELRNLQQQEQRRLRPHQQGHGRSRSWATPSTRPTRRQHDAADAGPASEVMAPDRDAGRRARANCGSSTSDMTNGGRSTARPGTTSSTAATRTCRRHPSSTRSRSGRSRTSRRLVPPAPHPPRRLQDPHPQRQAAVRRTSGAPRTSSTSARARRCGVLMQSSRPRRSGRYMVHCHNLPHEDHDMMQQFEVGAIDVNDPISSAPCRPDTGEYDDGWHDDAARRVLRTSVPKRAGPGYGWRLSSRSCSGPSSSCGASWPNHGRWPARAWSRRCTPGSVVLLDKLGPRLKRYPPRGHRRLRQPAGRSREP